MNLLISDMYRFVKEKVLYILLGVLAVLSLGACVFSRVLNTDGELTVTQIMLQGVGVNSMSIFVGIAVAFLCGKDYECNTIRNKICCGEGRFKIYFAKLVESLIVATAFFVFSLLCFTIFGAFFFKFKGTEEFGQKLICEWLLLLGFTAIVNCFCVTTRSIKATIIFTVVQYLVFNVITTSLPAIGDTFIVKAICRASYYTVSVMMIGSTNGTYTVNLVTDEQITSIEYGGLYLNVILVALVYTVVAIGISLIVTRKQEYK